MSSCVQGSKFHSWRSAQSPDTREPGALDGLVAKTLTQVVDELNRYHAGRIVVLGTDIRRILVSGTYHLSDTSAILDTLAQTLPIHKIQLTHRLVLLY